MELSRIEQIRRESSWRNSKNGSKNVHEYENKCECVNKNENEYENEIENMNMNENKRVNVVKRLVGYNTEWHQILWTTTSLK